uniref:Unconventional myosin-Va n=1 Tax=Anthurium amnicola TaxID=1678845 RepID=A0A1D1XYZ5_9ARAE
MPEVRTTTFSEAPVEVSLEAHSEALLEALPEVATSEGVAGVLDQVPHAAVKAENLCSKAPPAVPGTSTARELLGFGWPTGTRRRTRPLDAEANFFFNLVREVLAAGASVALDDIRGQLEDITGSYFLAGLPKAPWMDFIRHVWSFVVCRWHLEEARLKHQAELVTQLATLEEDAAGEEEKAQQAAEAVTLHQCSYDEAAAAATDLESRIKVLKIDLEKVHSQKETHHSEVFHQERCREEHVLRASRMRATMNLLCQQMEASLEDLPSVDEVMERNPLNQAHSPSKFLMYACLSFFVFIVCMSFKAIPEGMSRITNF